MAEGNLLQNQRLNEEQVHAHIESFNPQIYHFQHVPHHCCLDSNLSIKTVFDDYSEKNGDCKKSIYYRILKEMKISFMVPDQDMSARTTKFMLMKLMIIMMRIVNNA